MTDIVGLLDTNILIDISRGHNPALTWMRNNAQLILAIPSLVQMEMILGTQNKMEQEKVTRILQPFTIVYPNEIDAEWAMKQFTRFHLSHRIEIIDCFIAATSVRLQLPVYTRNTKDLGVFKDVVIVIPY
jgi:tRNA(fMet)-specific endonuclease VapC